MIAQDDEPGMLRWLLSAQVHGGGFLTAVATMGLCADSEDYHLVRGVLSIMRAKYSIYERLGYADPPHCHTCGHPHQGKCTVSMGGAGECGCELEVGA